MMAIKCMNSHFENKGQVMSSPSRLDDAPQYSLVYGRVHIEGLVTSYPPPSPLISLPLPLPNPNAIDMPPISHVGWREDDGHQKCIKSQFESEEQVIYRGTSLERKYPPPKTLQ